MWASLHPKTTPVLVESDPSAPANTLPLDKVRAEETFTGYASNQTPDESDGDEANDGDNGGIDVIVVCIKVGVADFPIFFRDHSFIVRLA